MSQSHVWLCTLLMQIARKHTNQQLLLIIRPSPVSNNDIIFIHHQQLRVGMPYVQRINLIAVQQVYLGYTTSTQHYCTMHCQAAGDCVLRGSCTLQQGWCRFAMAVCMHSVSCSHPHSFTLSLILNNSLPLGTVTGHSWG